LIGAPPGYIGHSDGGYLSESMKKNKKAIILFDEIEKAHKKVHNLLLQIMDDGRLTDNKGNVVDFSKSVIIMTSNVGVDPLENIEKSIGFGEKNIDHVSQKRETTKDLKKQFSPEFINRIDEIILFKDLTDDDKIKIAVKMLEEIRERIIKVGIHIEFSNSVPSFIVEKEEDKKYGARPINRTIKRFIEFPLSDKILSGSNISSVKVSVRSGKIIFKEKL
jgi:ATP-dependent Clp protease ATP-binding subunit ClpC